MIINFQMKQGLLIPFGVCKLAPGPASPVNNSCVHCSYPPLLSLVSRPRSRSRDSGDENEPIQERFFRPHFLQAPGDLTVQEGKLCRMDCKVSVSGPAVRASMREMDSMSINSYLISFTCKHMLSMLTLNSGHQTPGNG